MSVWLASSVSNDWAYGKMNKMVQIAHALAIASHCPALRINQTALESNEHYFHINVIKDGMDAGIMWGMISRANGKLGAMSREAVCTDGRLLFGAQGVQIKDLLTED